MSHVLCYEISERHHMKHAFEVGKRYRNRDGEYQVVTLKETTMVIRYLNGRTVESPIALQARIWENIQEDDEYGSENQHDVDINL